jgi:hypothetical protein
METDRSPDFVPSTVSVERKAILNQATKLVSTVPVQQKIELDKVLEEMAEIIEKEGGILTP